MLRRIICLLCAVVLSGCTLAPEETPIPVPCPECPTPVTCPVCPTSAPVVITATALPATATPEPSPIPTQIETPSSPPTAAPIEPAPSAIPPALTPRPYVLQEGTPAMLQNFAHADLACQWQGVAGQVLSPDGSPVLNVVVEVTGLVDNRPVDLVGLTGSALDYGAGGYEIELSRRPVESSGVLAIQLFDLDNRPLSDPVLFDTSAECGKNLVLINYVASGQ